MSWTERLPSGRYRGGWRDPAGNKHYTRRPEFPEHPYERKSDAKEAAQEAEVRARRQAAVGRGTLSSKITWGDWWDVIAPDRVRADTNTDDVEARIVRQYLRPRWGKVALNQITHNEVKEWVKELRGGKAVGWERQRKPEPSYVCRIYAVFRASIQTAVEGNVLTASPCAAIKLPKIPRKRKQYLTTDQAAQIGKELRADYRDAIEFDLETGLRPNEMCGLHADRIDRARMVVEVDQVLVDRKYVIRPFPKDKDARIVPLSAAALAIVDRRLAGRDLTSGCGVEHVDGSACESVLVFLTDRGRPMNSQVLGDRMRYAAKTKGVPRRSPYSARRGFATRLADGGVDAFGIKRTLGHATMDQADEYVQETAAAHSRVLAALGDVRPLSIVPGASGADPGADSSQQATRSDAIERAEDAV